METYEIRALAIELLRKTAGVEEEFFVFSDEWEALYKALEVTQDELASPFPIGDTD